MPRFSEKLHITLPESSFEMYNAEKPSLDVEISKDELLDMYNKMVTMRRMEMSADGLYKAKKIRGFCHLCNGQVNYLSSPFFSIFLLLLLFYGWGVDFLFILDFYLGCNGQTRGMMGKITPHLMSQLAIIYIGVYRRSNTMYTNKKILLLWMNRKPSLLVWKLPSRTPIMLSLLTDVTVSLTFVVVLSKAFWLN